MDGWKWGLGVRWTSSLIAPTRQISRNSKAIFIYALDLSRYLLRIQSCNNTLSISPAATAPLFIAPTERFRPKMATAANPPAPSAPPTYDTIDIAPTGDLILHVDHGSSSRRFRVHSLILTLASPVFGAMLAPDSAFSERRQLDDGASSGKTAVVKLLDDPLSEMEIVLNALHLQNDLVPEKVSADELYSLAVLCDKYALVRALGAWPGVWMRALKYDTPVATEAVDEDELAKRFAVSCIFQQEEYASGCARPLVTLSARNWDILVERVDDGVTGRFMDQLSATRESAMREVLRVVYAEFTRRYDSIREKYSSQWVEGIRDSPPPSTSVFGYLTPRKTLCTKGSPLCDVLQFGSICSIVVHCEMLVTKKDFRERDWSEPTSLDGFIQYLRSYDDYFGGPDTLAVIDKGGTRDGHKECSARNKMVVELGKLRPKIENLKKRKEEKLTV